MWGKKSSAHHRLNMRSGFDVKMAVLMNGFMLVECHWNNSKDICVSGPSLKVIWFLFGVNPAVPPLIAHFSSWVPKNSLPLILHYRVRSDLVLSSIPLPLSAICHSRVLAAKDLLWKDFKAFTVSHSTFAWLNKLFLLYFPINKQFTHLFSLRGESNIQWIW